MYVQEATGEPHQRLQYRLFVYQNHTHIMAKEINKYFFSRICNSCFPIQGDETENKN